MIPYEKFTLPNGLKVMIHQDKSTPIVAMNILYHVGAKDEDPERTGFAHLFEHLMFEGSVNIPVYDEPLEKAGGQNNAFTNNDFTNYYLSIPKPNLETAFWLESDRMLGLDLSEEKVRIQKQVVMEEYKQRYLNQPYGDLWLLLRPLAFKVHPYRWPTIGMDLEHIRNAKHPDVLQFFDTHYAPGNAILTLAGDVDPDQVYHLAEKWFGPIQRPYLYRRSLTPEPPQTEKREEWARRDVPLDGIYKCFHTYKRYHEDYAVTEVIADLFSQGDSSILYQELVKKKQIFADVNAFVTGEMENGLMIFGGRVNQGVSPEEADRLLTEQIERLASELVDDPSLEKVRNQMVTTLSFSELKALEKAMNLAFYECLGDAALWERETCCYLNTSKEKIREVCQKFLTGSNSSTLYYICDHTKT